MILCEVVGGGGRRIVVGMGSGMGWDGGFVGGKGGAKVRDGEVSKVGR